MQMLWTQSSRNRLHLLLESLIRPHELDDQLLIVSWLLVRVADACSKLTLLVARNQLYSYGHRFGSPGDCSIPLSSKQDLDQRKARVI